MAGELADFPGTRARELEHLSQRLGRLDADRVQAEGEARAARSELDALGPLKRRGPHADELRADLRRTQIQLDYLGDQTDAATRQVAKLRAEHDPVAWIERHADQVRDLRAIDHELAVRKHQVQRQLVRAAQSDPPEHVTAVLGDRPENYATRLQWERGVWAIEIYRHATASHATTTTPRWAASRLAAKTDKIGAKRSPPSAKSAPNSDSSPTAARRPNSPPYPTASPNPPSTAATTARPSTSATTANRHCTPVRSGHQPLSG